MVAIVHHQYGDTKEWKVLDNNFEYEYDAKSPTQYAHMYEHYNPVTMVEADGFELNRILILCKNVPHIPNAKKQVWTGDLARLVVQALN